MWIVEWDHSNSNKRYVREFDDEGRARNYFNCLSDVYLNRNILIYERSDVNEYKMPDPPNNPVIDNLGRVWVRGEKDNWWWHNGTSSSWFTILVHHGPLKDAPKKPTKEDIVNTLAESVKKNARIDEWADSVWDVVKDWIKD